MRPGAAKIQPRQRPPVIGLTQHRPRTEQLVQAQRAVEDVATNQAEGPLKIQRTHDLPAEHRSGKTRRMLFDGGDHQIRDFFAMIIPAASIRQLRGNVLAEQAGDVSSWRCK